MLMSRIVFVVLLLFVTSSLSMNRFSTKTPYIFTKQSILNNLNFEPKKAWVIVRHGTRLPSKKVISRYYGLVELKEQLLNKSNSLSEQQRKAFNQWVPMNIELENQKFLTVQGEQEQFKLGVRFRERFPKFFDGNSQSSFTFKHTPTQRTELSAKKFIEGLFPSQEQSHKSTVVARDDPVLRPYKGCELWRKTVKKNKEVSLKEYRDFEVSEQVENLVNKFRDVTQIDHLTIFDVEVIYTVCAFENSWQYKLFNGQSIWCSLFQNDQQLRVMEYFRDLEYYWIDGPGFEITRKVACKTVEDILQQLDPANKDQKLSFYFTHSGTILKLLTFLELYRDEFDLTAKNFSDNRLWKTSFIDMFSSNIAVILYESKTGEPYIQILHQEQVINLPKCQMNEFGMCSWENFKKIYGDKIKNCTLETICQPRVEL